MLEIKPIFNTLLRHKSSTLLLVLQIAITLAVVVNAIYIINERISLMKTKSGVPEAEIITFSINAFEKNYDFKNNYLADEIVLKSIPGVVDAAIVNSFPLAGGGDSSGVSRTEEESNNHQAIGVAFYRGNENMLNTFGVNLISGRDFRKDEVIYIEDLNKLPKVTIITQSLADKLFPGGDALGNTVFYWGNYVTVIGIVENLVSPWANSQNHNMSVMLPAVPPRNFIRAVVRVEKGESQRVMSQIEEQLLKRNPNRVILKIKSMLENRQDRYEGDSAMAKILITVIVLLILITALGIVGLASFNINQRVKQIGTRRALGATRMDIIRYFITENILTTSIGLTLGLFLAISFNMYLVNTFQLSPIDWFYIPVGMLIMLLSGVMAVWLPAKKASMISPAVATQSI